MKASQLAALLCAILPAVLGNPVTVRRGLDDRDFMINKPGSKHLRPYYEKRQVQGPGFANGQPISADGKGGIISGGTDRQIDIANPANLGAESTDAGIVPNLKWRFADSKARLLNGGWVRESLITDLPASGDIAGAQFHLNKGRVSVAAVDENGRNQFEILEIGDVWYFPKGEAHVIQGLDDNNEFLLAFDECDFEAPGTTFHLDDWVYHTPRDILAKNFGVDASVFDEVPATNPYIQNSTVNTENIDHPFGELSGNMSYVYKASKVPATQAPGGGGTYKIIDTTTFPIAKTIAAAVFELKPGALRELHWHPNGEEWLYFHKGEARASVYIGGARARSFDFRAGDTAVFPDNAGHYIENTSKNETLVWIELFKADKVKDISLTQWLALTPVPIVSAVLRVSEDVVRSLKKEKQFIVQ